MPYVIDAHALIWYFTNDSKLSERARDVFNQIDAGDETGLVPIIVLAEILYASERGRISLTLDSVLKELQKRKYYRVVSVTLAILQATRDVKNVRELHDRTIVATAVHHNAIVVSRDPDIANSGVVKTLW